MLLEKLLTANMIAMLESFMFGVGAILLMALAFGAFLGLLWLTFKIFDSF